MADEQAEIWEACPEANAIIYHPGLPNAYFTAKEVSIPSILATLFPLKSTRECPSSIFQDVL